ncbi:hypothetical protein PFISCL1PPCAC_13681, partial [Pristionchus fissidentatus]
MTPFLNVLDVLLGLFGIPGNMLLIVAILFSRDGSLKAYSLILFYSAFFDLIEVIAEVMGMTRMMANFPYLVYIFEGFCTHVNTFTCKLAMQIELHFMFISMLLIAVSFWYRNTVLSGRYPSWLNVQLVICAVLTPMLSSTVSYFQIIDSV